MKRRLGFIILICIIAVTLTAQLARADSIVMVGACATSYYPWSLEIQNSYGYIADLYSFVIIDVSNPSNPTIKSVLEDPLTDRAKGVFLKDTLAYVRSTSILAIVNIANVDTPLTVGYCGISSEVSHTGIFVSDTIAFVTDRTDGIIICNVKDPTNPFVVDTFATDLAINLTMRDSILFIADYDSLLIVNAKDPLNLFRISSVAIPEGVYDVAVQGNYAYATEMSSYGTDGKVKIIDISDIQNPIVIGEMVGIRGDPVAIYLENGYVYVAAEDWWQPPKKKQGKANVEGGIRIGYTNPDSSSVIASYDTPGNPQDVYVVGDLIYVADYDSVQILRHIGAGVEEGTKIKVKRVRIKVHPNPFSGVTNIAFTITSSKNGRIEIYDAGGRKVRTLYTGRLSPAKYRFYWNGLDDRGGKVVNGEYFATITLNGLVVAKKKIVYIIK